MAGHSGRTREEEKELLYKRTQETTIAAVLFSFIIGGLIIGFTYIYLLVTRDLPLLL